MAGKAALRALVLGASAGGGFPQWNCNCHNCAAVRRGEPGFLARTQSSLAVSANGVDWAVINASPDINKQIQSNAALQPGAPLDVGLRASPIRSVLVTNGDIDHVIGLLSLREQQPFRIFATAELHRVLAENPVFQAVDPKLVPRLTVDLEKPFEILPGVTARLFAVPGKVPLYLEGEVVKTDLIGEQTVGVEFSGADGSRFFYVPGCARLSEDLARRLGGAGLLFFDGTVFHDDEMIRAGVGIKTGSRMGHLSMAGEDGSLASFAPLNIGRKIFVHINNTNPVLDGHSPERAMAEAAGWEIGYDGMEVRL